MNVAFPNEDEHVHTPPHSNPVPRILSADLSHVPRDKHTNMSTAVLFIIEKTENLHIYFKAEWKNIFCFVYRMGYYIAMK